MNKDNIFKSSSFFMSKGDVLHIIFLDEAGTPVTVELQETTAPGEVINVVPGKPIPKNATDVTSSSFTANWSMCENTLGYFLDVARDVDFTMFLINNLDVGYVTNYSVSVQDNFTPYYYRIRAYNFVGTGVNSDSVSVITPAALLGLLDRDGNEYTTVTIGNQEWIVENLKTTHYADGYNISNITSAGTSNPVTDWFLPSKDELNAIYTELYLYGVGSFGNGWYWSSSESAAYSAWAQYFITGAQIETVKVYNEGYTLAIRSFISAAIYNLRDVGPSGGWIFHIIDNGNGTYTYYETAITDIEDLAWSNIIGIEIGATAQGTAIGTGQANTTAIMAQTGHNDSAAKLCNDLSVDVLSGEWVDDTDGAYCWYNNDEGTYKVPYGALYNWYAVNNAKGLVYFERNGVQEVGWRVPSNSDWSALLVFLGDNAAQKMKEIGTTHWIIGGTNESGFTAIAGGTRDVSFEGVNDYALWWCSTEFDIDDASYLALTSDNMIGLAAWLKRIGRSVRCVRDIVTDEEMKYLQTINLTADTTETIVTPLTTEPYNIMVLNSTGDDITYAVSVSLALVGGVYEIYIYSIDSLSNVKLKILY